MPNKDEALVGGGLGGAVRVGDTVRRPAGPWTPAVHALLDHLSAVGFDGAPRALGLDEEGREVLTYVEGEAGPPTGLPDDDEALVSAAQLIRRFHDAAEGFVMPEGAEWQFMVGAPHDGPLVCHNDLAPGNSIYMGGRARSLIDWDFAAPGTRTWDLAYALYRFVPLYPDSFFESRNVRPPDRARRLRLFCDTYGLDQRTGLIDLIRRRVEVLYESVRAWARSGRPDYVRIWRDTAGKQWLDTIAFLDTQRGAWESALS